MNPRTPPPPDFNVSINKEILSSTSSACMFVRRQMSRNSSAKSFLFPYCYLSSGYGKLDLRRVSTVLCCMYNGFIACDIPPASPPSPSPQAPYFFGGPSSSPFAYWPYPWWQCPWGLRTRSIPRRHLRPPLQPPQLLLDLLNQSMVRVQMDIPYQVQSIVKACQHLNLML